jgi:hypothetical protein
MCLQCCTNAEYWGDPLEGIGLYKARRDAFDGDTTEWQKDEWGLIILNDPFAYFKTTPEEEPIEASDILWNEWADKAIKFSEEIRSLEIINSWKLVEMARNKGYSNGSFTIWLFDHLGKFLKTAKVIE